MDGSSKLFPVAGNPDASVNGFSNGHPRLLREMAKIMKVDAVDHFILHDLRRTVATGMQRLGVPMPVTEAVLNHISGSRSGIAGASTNATITSGRNERRWRAGLASSNGL